MAAKEYIDDSYFASVHDKQVTQDPTPIIFYRARNSERVKTLVFHTMESDTLGNNVLKAKDKVGVLEFVGKKLLKETSDIVGFCNGLVLIETYDPEAADGDQIPTFTVIHPINKQCYALPKLPLRGIPESCGLGFDSSTNTFKMVCVYHNPNYPNCGASSAHCTMVHVFGTHSWIEIPKVPSHELSGKAIFAHGCLHWLVECNNGEDGPRQVIWFDVKNEEFGSIKPPKRNNIYHLNAHLVNLDGQLGYFDASTVWILNDKKEWMLHCDFKDYEFQDESFIDALGCLNKDGDILFKGTNWRTLRQCIYIYNLKNRVMHEAWIHGLDLEDGSKADIACLKKTRRIFGRDKHRVLVSSE